MLCYRCGSNVADRALKCSNCGAELGSATRMMRISKGSLKALRKQKGGEPSSAASSSQTSSHELTAGAVIAGRYEVRGVLGRGPFGVVYDALDRELESEVAVKVFPAALLPAPADRERFEGAMRQARRLTQQNLVRLFDSGFTEDHAFVVMQRLEGLDLARLRSLRAAEQGAYTRAELDSLLPQLVAALQHCHRTTFHGDLKPENILLQPDRLKITDVFVFEALPHAALEAEAARSVYASPEVQEARHAADSRSDIYSLGVILAELLGGEALEGEVILPSARNADVPAAVDAALARATRRDPAQRFATVEELSEALRAAWGGLALPLTEPTALALHGGALVSGEHVVISADDILEVEEVGDLSLLAAAESAAAQGLLDPLDIPTAMDIGEEDAEEIEELDADAMEEDAPFADTMQAPEADEKTQTTPLQDLLDTRDFPREVDEADVEEIDEADAVLEEGEEESAAGAEAASDAAQGEAKPSGAGAAAVSMLFDDGAALKARKKKESGPKERKKKKSFMRPVEGSRSKEPAEPEEAAAAAAPVVVTAVTPPPPAPAGAAASARAAGRSLETERVRTLPKTKDRGEAVRTTRNTTLIAVVAIFALVLGVVGVMAWKNNNKGPQTVAGFGARPDAPQGEALAPVSLAPASSAPASVAVASVDAGAAELPDAAVVEPDAAAAAVVEPDAAASEPVASAPVSAPVSAPATTPAPTGSVQVVAAKPPEEVKGKEPVEKKPPEEKKPPAEVAKVEPAGKVTPGEPKCPGGMAAIKNKDNKFPPYCIDRFEHPGGGARPTTGVSWHGADSACKAQGKRLCAIQEWQRGCGAKYPWGAKWDPNKCVTEDADELERSVQPTGSMKTCRNGWGLFDMVGNVAEWVQEQRVVGGDATSGEKSASCYYATNKAPGSGSPLVGFRCCADPTFE